MTDIKVIDNVLDEEYFFQIQSHILSTNWPWYYMDNISNVEDNNNYGFFNILVNENGVNNIGPLNELIQETSQRVGSNQLIRCRMDMTTNRGDSIKLEPHVDLTYPHTTAIFYVNDVDGNTIIYDQMYGDDSKLTIKQEIQPKANRLIIFNGLHLHTGHTPTTCNQRVLINSNFR